ncbi:fatty acid desaturase family protein [Actinopolymorpha alba]|uniref:fatty acid desaturase family protein n=1 Tax=Actinopolymorpha alba TaxID=533267 RepID=UPI00036498F4|nr:acyl-CoA desaturase [Actinopolymorpha alba]
MTLSLLGGTIAGFFLLGDSWLQIVLAAILAVLFTQIAFLAHDVGHRQVFTSRRTAQIVGLLLADAGIGLSYGWWIGKHTRHHANPNHVDDDPDVGVGVIAWSEEHARERRGVAGRALAGWQAFLFFPLLLLEGLNLYVSGIRALWQRGVKHKGLEALLLGLHTAACLSAVFLVLSPGKALVFLAVHQGIFGFYMGCSFAPNHKGMPLLEEKMDFLRKQVLTSRNVRGSWFVDHALGGLNYQIEHHLFPSMPMPNLRRAKPLVQAFCDEHGIPYHDAGLFRSYREVLTYLHQVGACLRSPQSTNS